VLAPRYFALTNWHTPDELHVLVLVLLLQRHAAVLRCRL
jgi:hypothetical protein